MPNFESLPKPAAEARDPYIVETEKTVSYLGVEVAKGQGGPLVPDRQESANYFYTEADYILRREIATSLVLNKPLLFEGGTGIGKTSAVSSMCAELNMNFCKVSFGRDMAVEDVIGSKTIVTDEAGKESVRWYDGNLMVAVRHGGVALLDEYNFQGSKIGSRVNPIIDAILNGRKEVSLPENDNERVLVHPDFRLVAAQNPPGTEEGQEFIGREVLSAETFGRWTFHKLPLDMDREMRLKRMAGMIGEKVDISLPAQELRFLGEGIPLRELKNIPGMSHWVKMSIEILDQLKAKSIGSKRAMAKGQRQNIYFNPRLEQGLLNYVSRFYRGDVNEVWNHAFEHLVTGMYKSEADKQKVREVLNQSAFVPPAPESKRKPLKGKSAKKIVLDSSVRLEITSSLVEAEAIMGKDFLGPKAVENCFNIVKIEYVPRIYFTREELEHAKELNQQLILYIDKAADGTPLNLVKINSIRGGKASDGKKLLYRSDDSGGITTDAWFKAEIFANEEVPQLGWKLVTKEVIPDSTGQDYIGQTQKLIEYLPKVFPEGIPATYQEAITEFNEHKDDLVVLVQSDWSKASQVLAELKITQLTRESAAEAMYRLALTEHVTKEKLLPKTYTWTKTRSSEGYLVLVGNFVGRGADVSRHGPDDRYAHLGVCFSRSD